jgi:hypothetical protein
MSGMTNEEVLKYLPERYHAIYENCFPAPRPEIQDDRNWFPQICVDFASARKEFEELKAQVMRRLPCFDEREDNKCTGKCELLELCDTLRKKKAVPDE